MELEKYDGSDPNLNLNLKSGALLTELVKRSNVFSSGRINLLVPGVRHQCNGMGEILVD